MTSAEEAAPYQKGTPVTFEVGQKVVYPNHGVSVVEEISLATFDDSDKTLLPPAAAVE